MEESLLAQDEELQALMEKKLLLFSGSANPELAEAIADHLGLSLGKVKLEKFSNGEIYACFQESVRGANVFIVQSVAGTETMGVNDALMELLIMIDAAKRASARRIVAVVAHYGYARQDRKAAAREPITAKLVADLITAAGATRVLTIDLHQGQIQGFFDIPVDHMTALPILADYYKKKDFGGEQLCVVSPDLGRAKAAKRMSDLLGADLAIMHKGRPGHNKAVITALIGDVNGKICIMNDDMIDTGGSVLAAALTLKSKGAKEIYVCCTHPVLSGAAFENLDKAPIKEVVVCDTIPLPHDKRGGKYKVVSVAPLLARAIRNIYNNGSVSEIFDRDYSL